MQACMYVLTGGQVPDMLAHAPQPWRPTRSDPSFLITLVLDSSNSCAAVKFYYLQEVIGTFLIVQFTSYDDDTLIS